MKGLSLFVFSKTLPFFVVICFLIDIGLCVSYITDYLINQPFIKLTLLLDLDGESSFATWFSSVQLFSIFILTSIFACYNYNHDKKSLLLFGLPILYLAMSIDEISQIHEWLGNKTDALLSGGDRRNSLFKITGIWMFVLGIPFIVFFILWMDSIKFYFYNKLSSYKKIIIGMIVFLTGALAIEIFSNFVTDILLIIEIVAEEGLEMIGATIMLWAAYELVADYFPNNSNIVHA